MRFALAALLLTGCVIAPPDSGDDYPSGGSGGGGWGSGSGGSGGTGGYGCQSDAACGTGYVCARNGECTTSSSVRIVHTLWTVHDQVASDATCSAAPALDITFSTSGGEQFGFAPVPCDAGKYTIDKMPTRYTMVNLARSGDYAGGANGVFDANGNASLDLPY
ncbi:MAG TPA: hypothetical protein VIV40_36665 [Kofleriaceae bacterium]